MNNKIKLILKRFGQNYKKELIIILFINFTLIACMIVTYIYTHNNLFFIPFIFIIVLTNAITFYRYLFLYSKNISQQIKELTLLLRYLYLEVNNQIKVKEALNNLKEHASLKLNNRLKTLLEEIKQDASLFPYLHFASTFNNVMIEEVMLNLYRLEKRPHKENLLHFNEAYFKLKRVVEKEEENDSKHQFGFVNTSAIIGTAIIVILVIIVIVIMLEKYLHG